MHLHITWMYVNALLIHVHVTLAVLIRIYQMWWQFFVSKMLIRTYMYVCTYVWAFQTMINVWCIIMHYTQFIHVHVYTCTSFHFPIDKDINVWCIISVHICNSDIHTSFHFPIDPEELEVYGADVSSTETIVTSYKFEVWFVVEEKDSSFGWKFCVTEFFYPLCDNIGLMS